MQNISRNARLIGLIGHKTSLRLLRGPIRRFGSDHWESRAVSCRGECKRSALQFSSDEETKQVFQPKAPLVVDSERKSLIYSDKNREINKVYIYGLQTGVLSGLCGVSALNQELFLSIFFGMGAMIMSFSLAMRLMSCRSTAKHIWLLKGGKSILVENVFGSKEIIDIQRINAGFDPLTNMMVGNLSVRLIVTPNRVVYIPMEGDKVINQEVLQAVLDQREILAKEIHSENHRKPT